jgi:hypothetical protein
LDISGHHERVKTKLKQTQDKFDQTDISAVWARTKKRLERMTSDEIQKTLVSAGIFTKKGNPTKPYRGVFVKAKASFASNAK